MAVTYEIKNFETGGSNKLVGFTVTHNTGKVLVIDKEVAISGGKTDEQYTQEALALAQPEIDAWDASSDRVGKKWDPNTNSFV